MPNKPEADAAEAAWRVMREERNQEGQPMAKKKRAGKKDPGRKRTAELVFMRIDAEDHEDKYWVGRPYGITLKTLCAPMIHRLFDGVLCPMEESVRVEVTLKVLGPAAD